jgi:hypothetical protein
MERKASMSLQEKLEQANKKAEAQKAERRRKTVKGSHLTETFLTLAREAGCDLRDNNGFHVIVGKAGKSLRIYVAKRGGIVDLLGFSVQDKAVRQISKEEAKEKHMGRVQGRLDLEQTDEAILTAYRAALVVINTPLPEPEKKPRAPRKPKEPTTEAVQAPAAPAEAPAQA